MTLGAGVLVTMLVSNVAAGCGLPDFNHPWVMAQTTPELRLATPAAKPGQALYRGEGGSSSPSIVGMWDIQFISQGNTSHNPPIPDGAVISIGFQIWHSDGTEWHNNGSLNPATQNYCEGVWGQTGFNAYELNHFAYTYDSTGTNTGMANIKEQVTESPSGDSFVGNFTIDIYDTKGVHQDHIGGALAASRVTVDTVVTPEP